MSLIYFTNQQTKFFRYFRFYDYGRVLYMINNKYPVDSVDQMTEGISIAKKIFEGTYTLRRNEVTVQVISQMFLF
jgi:hypothetical protein